MYGTENRGLRRKVGRIVGAFRPRASRAATGRAPTPVADGCLVCGAPRTPYEPVSFARNPELVRNVSICSDCGYVAIEEQENDRYRAATSMDQLPQGSRIGTEEKPGREFYMARMSLDILRRRNVEVLVYGIGRSLDNRHIANLKRVRNVAIGDIMKVRDDAEFHDANQPARKQFPIVVASEVIEHFRNPREDFAKLFQFVAEDGLLVCGTNVYDGGDLTRHRYIYFPDHTSYYTPQALLQIAKPHGFQVDFRTPKIAGQSGRKRYVIFTKSTTVAQNIALYFGTRSVAPSE